MPCLLCGMGTTRLLLLTDGQSYWACPRCEACFLDPRDHPSREAELAHYLHHQNDITDARYRRFLARLATPLLARLPPRSTGLDYGCGPGAALAAMLQDGGHFVNLYDPFFAPDATVLTHLYDFVTCTETAEHFHRPATEFARLMAMVRPGGWLAIMTCFRTRDDAFEGWHYRKDPTHVIFYREATLRWLAARDGWSCDIPTKDVALLRRPVASEARQI